MLLNPAFITLILVVLNQRNRIFIKKKKTVINASAMDPYLLKIRNISLLVFLSFMWLYLMPETI